jgi:2-polyprenyl-3-methyl-5-hydroxy-6-metoxy-1,4-benzoquinol methylase
MLKKFFTQTRFPRLWLLFQHIVGGIPDKRKMAIKYYTGQKKVLEIGCSVGIVSKAFIKFPDIEFTGIDIDDNALVYARKLFKDNKNFRFLNISLSDLAKSGEKFDYILFANILHHADDETVHSLMKDIKLLLSHGATLVIQEPEKIRDDYNLFFKFFYLLEQGQFRRPASELVDLIKDSGLEIKSVDHVLMAPNSLPFLHVGRCILIEIKL